MAGHSRPPIAIEPDAYLLDCLRGTAQRRGEIHRPATLEAARRVCADLGGPLVVEALAVVCLEWARAAVTHSGLSPPAQPTATTR